MPASRHHHYCGVAPLLPRPVIRGSSLPRCLGLPSAVSRVLPCHSDVGCDLARVSSVRSVSQRAIVSRHRRRSPAHATSAPCLPSVVSPMIVARLWSCSAPPVVPKRSRSHRHQHRDGNLNVRYFAGCTNPAGCLRTRSPASPEGTNALATSTLLRNRRCRAGRVSARDACSLTASSAASMSARRSP